MTKEEIKASHVYGHNVTDLPMNDIWKIHYK